MAMKNTKEKQRLSPRVLIIPVLSAAAALALIALALMPGSDATHRPADPAAPTPAPRP